MKDETSMVTGPPTTSLSDLLTEVDIDVLKRFASFAKASQFKSVFARNLHLANWFEALGDIVRDELRRRDGKDGQLKVSPADAEVHLRERTEVMTDQELEALGMGFASLMAAGDDRQDTALPTLIEAVYEPVRQEYVRRHRGTGNAVRG